MSINSSMTSLITEAYIFLSGVEAVLEDGSTICKPGTNLAALVARKHHIPFFLLVATMKLKVSSLFSYDFQLDALELEDIFGRIDDSPAYSNVPACITNSGFLFDRTPSSLFHGIVTERGIFCSDGGATLMRQIPYSTEIVNKLFNQLSAKRRKEVKVSPGRLVETGNIQWSNSPIPQANGVF